jgi:regulator of replication initiation timing
VQQLRAHVLQLQQRLQAQQQAAAEAARLEAESQQLRTRLQSMELERAKDRAQLDAFHASQLAAAAEGQPRVRP